MRSEFMKELWGRTASRERGESSFEKKAIELFFEIKANAEGNGVLEQLVGDFESAAVRYASTIARWEETRMSRSELDDFTNAEMAREKAHDSFVDSANILSRAFRKNGLDNRWRGKMGTDRKEIGPWGIEIAHFIAKSQTSQEGEPYEH